MDAGHRVKLSKGSLLLLHLAEQGHVWRDGQRRWVASTQRNKRVVDLRINNLIDRGILRAAYQDNFPTVTSLGLRYLNDHPIENLLKTKIT